MFQMWWGQWTFLRIFVALGRMERMLLTEAKLELHRVCPSCRSPTSCLSLGEMITQGFAFATARDTNR
jgi:hypothetical protein